MLVRLVGGARDRPRMDATHDNGSGRAGVHQLDPVETTAQCPPEYLVSQQARNHFDPESAPLWTLEETFRHSGWRAGRKKVADALARTQSSHARQERFASCGAHARVWISDAADDGSYRWRVSCDRCRDRWCVPCQRERSMAVRARLRQFLALNPCKFVTLTLKHRRARLVDDLRRLRVCFAALRRRKWWIDRVKGGVAILEVKTGRDGLWHVHLHMLALTTYLDARQLSEEWRAVTGDSFIVHVKQATDDAAGYLTSYVTKGLRELIRYDADKLDEAMISLKGVRLFQTFGAVKAKDLKEKVEETDKALISWHCLGTLQAVLASKWRAYVWLQQELRTCMNRSNAPP